MSTNDKNNLWPNRTAVLIGDEKNLYLVLKELLRALGWQIAVASGGVGAATQMKHEGGASCFIVVDTPTQPATEILRVLFKDSRTRLTPTIVITGGFDRVDRLIYEKIFQVHVSAKPVTANNLSADFKSLVTLWEQPVMTALRKVSAIADQGNSTTKIEILDRLTLHPTAMPFALASLTQILIVQGQYREAEQKLLELCRTNPQNPAMLAYCAWFYLAARIPAQAVRFLTKLKTIAPTSTLLNLDTAAAYLSMGDFTQAVNAMYEWHRRHPDNTFMEGYMARALIADGKHEHANEYGISRLLTRKITEHWQHLENTNKTEKTNPAPGRIAS